MKNSFMLLLMSAFLMTVSAQTLTLRGKVQISGNFHTDVVGYIDPNTNIEYAIAGDASSGGSVSIIDVSNPDNPQLASHISGVAGFDVRIWEHYIYTVNGGGNGQGSIIDITDPANPQVVGSFPSSHNIWIDNGYIYAEWPGLRILNLNNNPESPIEIWNHATGDGHDAAVIGNLLYDFHGGSGTNIYDVSNPNSPVLLSTIVDPTISYHHSGWVTEDGKYLFICDELAEHPQVDITVWDISNFDNPTKVGEYADPDAVVHNFYVKGNYAFVSYYTAGLRIFDISDPANLYVIQEYDTTPATGEFFFGAFGVYPYSPNNLVFVNDWNEGVFVFEFDDGATDIDDSRRDGLIHRYNLAQNFPNPFNPSTVIPFEIAQTSEVNIKIYNLLGQPVRTLVNNNYAPGVYEVEWDGKNTAGIELGSGVYFYRIQAGAFAKTMKMFKVE